MTTFKAAIGLCGLSQSAAAEYLGVSLASVKDWSRGKTAPSQGVWDDLADLYDRIEDAAEFAADKIEPDLMARHVMNQITADSGSDPLPSGADYAAGALALMLAVSDRKLANPIRS